MFIKKQNQKVDYQPLIDHVNQVVDWLQPRFKKYGIIVKAPNFFTAGAASIFAEAQKSGTSLKGLLYPEKVKALHDALEEFLKKENNEWKFIKTHLCLNGDIQAGKTTATFLLSILPLIINLLTNEASITIRSLYNQTDLEAMADEEAKMFQMFYEQIEFHKGKNFYTAESFVAMMKSETKKHADNFMGDNWPVVGEAIRASGSKNTRVIQLLEKVKEHNIFLFLVRDESHSGASRNSIYIQQFGGPLEWTGRNICQIGLSGTNHALKAAFQQMGWPIIEMDTGPNHTSIKPNKELQPKCQSFKQLEELMGIEHAGWLFIKAQNIISGKNYQSYRSRLVNAFATLLKWCLVTHNPAKGNGLLARVINNNHLTEEFAKEVEMQCKKEGTNVEFLFFNANYRDENIKTLEHMIKSRECKEKPFVVFVTASARMGAVATPLCRYQLDTANRSQPQSLEQSLRILGYHKEIPWVFLSEYNTTLLNNYMETGLWINQKGNPVTPYNPHVKVSPEIINARETSTTVELNQILNHPFGEIEKQLLSRFSLGINWNGEILVKQIEFIIQNAAKTYSKTDYTIKRTKQGPILPTAFSEIIKIIAMKQQEREILLSEIVQGMIPIQIRQHDSKFGVGGRRGNTHDSQSGERNQPVFYVNRFMKLVSIRLRLKDSDLLKDQNLLLTHKSGYCVSLPEQTKNDNSIASLLNVDNS